MKGDELDTVEEQDALLKLEQSQKNLQKQVVDVTEEIATLRRETANREWIKTQIAKALEGLLGLSLEKSRLADTLLKEKFDSVDRIMRIDRGIIKELFPELGLGTAVDVAYQLSNHFSKFHQHSPEI